MKTVFVIINYDANEIEYATEDYFLAQEMITDMYMDTLYYEFLWLVNYEGASAAQAYQEAKVAIDAWFREYMVNEKTNMIE